jgi:hypothetical protein
MALQRPSINQLSWNVNVSRMPCLTKAAVPSASSGARFKYGTRPLLRSPRRYSRLSQPRWEGRQGTSRMR